MSGVLVKLHLVSFVWVGQMSNYAEYPTRLLLDLYVYFHKSGNPDTDIKQWSESYRGELMPKPSTSFIERHSPQSILQTAVKV